MLDHEPLSDACAEAGQILPLYILEPCLWNQPDVSYRHFIHLKHYLSQLDDMFIKKGAKLVIKVGEALPVLKSLATRHNVKAIFSHYETWNKFSKDRDSAIRKWTDENSIDWKEYQQNGVVKNLKCRDGWSTLWHNYMRKKIYEVPKKYTCISEDSDKLPSPQDLNLEFDGFKPNRDFGTTEPEIVLKSFLHERGENYQREMSGPLLSANSCSRLSTHIAFGTISIRTIFQRTQEQTQKIDLFGIKEKLASLLQFIPKKTSMALSFYPKIRRFKKHRMEKHSSIYDKLERETSYSKNFERWMRGETGFPFC